MIDFLTGKIEYKGNGYISLDVHDVGYNVFVNENCFSKLQEGDLIKLYVYQHIRENASDLYGFLKREEVEFFKLLLSVSGVGPKSALTVLSKADISDIQKAVINNDSEFLIKQKGVSKKTAERIVMEFKNKIDSKNFKTDNEGLSISQNDFTDEKGEVEDALIKLGYSKLETIKILGKMPAEILGADEKIKWALKNM
ncbi:MAG: Holliday junction branch migration protein RuvA [bacterium]